MLSRFPDSVLAGIIHDLYTPAQLPAGSQRYNFSWIDADILGRAYEKYLATVYLPVPPSPQLRLFDQHEREIEPVSVKKAGGVFYTPHYLFGTLTEEAIREVNVGQREADFIPRIADFSCGSGSFLVEAVSVLLRQLREHDPDRNWARALIEGKHVVGIDIDPRAVQMTRMNLWIRFTEEPDAPPLPSIHEVVVLGDALGTEVWEQLPKFYDVVLGNPPFIATGSVRPREELAKRFETARGRFDYAYLFVELAIRRLAAGGVLGMVVPNRLFRNRDAGVVRRMLTSDADLLSIIDFGTNEVFMGTSAYIGAVLARKRDSPNDPPGEMVRAVVVSDVSDTRYLGGVLVDTLRADGEHRHDSVAGFDIANPIGDRAWVLLSPAARRTRLRLEEASTPLGDIAGIFQGIRTGANDIFILDLESTDGPLARAVNGLGDSAILESALLHPVVFGADIQRYEILRTDRLLLYPYRDGAVIPESELREVYPNTYAYLMTYRDLLAGRNTITARNFRWYELAWERDEAWLSSSKLLTRDLARRTSFTLDVQGRVFLVGGTAVVPPDTDWTFPLLAYLNSAVATQYLAELTPAFRGGFLKFEPRHLSQLPIPAFLANQDDVGVHLGGLAMEVLRVRSMGEEERGREIEDEIDRIVAEMTGIEA